MPSACAETPIRPPEGSRVWERLPVAIDSPGKSVRLRWLKLDDDTPGPEFTMELNTNANRNCDSGDLHIIGRTQSRQLTWRDVCRNPQHMRRAGHIAEAHVVFEMKAVVDRNGVPRCARWSQGQIIYARNPRAGKYGYEIIMNSQSGVIVPCA